MNKIIWTCWWQGEEEMPPLVSLCLKSWQQKNPGWEMRVLDAVNCQQYVELPDLATRRITAASLSDILRINLLNEYGGVWVDATLYCNQPLDEWLFSHMKEGFFGFSKPHPKSLIASWFLAAEEHNLIVGEWQAAVSHFWLKNKASQEYLWFHQLFNRLYQSKPIFKDQWDKVTKVSANAPHGLQLHAFKSAKEYELVDFTSPVFKLSHRMDLKKFKPNTIIWKFLKQEQIGPPLKWINLKRRWTKAKTQLGWIKKKEPRPELDHAPFAMLKTSTENLGDHIQILAGLELTNTLGAKPTIKIDRDNEIHSAPMLEGKKGTSPILLNGWFKSNCKEWPPHEKLLPLYFSFHIRLFQCPKLVDETALAHYKKWEPIGCRDSYTQSLLQSKGIKTYLSHCLTLSFPKRTKDSSSQKEIIVISRDRRILDYLPKSLGPVSFVTHYSGSGDFEENMASAIALLDYYRKKAKLIITTMLHAANPAIALGIPVVMFYPLNTEAGHQSDRERFSSLADLVPIYSFNELENVNWSGNLVKIGMLKLKLREAFFSRSKIWASEKAKPIGPIASTSILPPPKWP